MPVFIDAEPGTYNIDVAHIEAMISPQTRAMMIPSLIGNLPDWDVLMDIANRFRGEFVILPMSRQDMADYLGLTIETVSRKLGELEDMGAIRREGKRGIALLDATMLQDISGR